MRNLKKNINAFHLLDITAREIWDWLGTLTQTIYSQSNMWKRDRVHFEQMQTAYESH